VHFVAPRSRALVVAPLTIRWTVSGFAVRRPGTGPPSRAAGYFAVFVDRAPVRPGDTLAAVAAGDPRCLHQPGCPDADYLAQRRVYTTFKPQITLPLIAPIAGDTSRVQTHAVTVVLLDTAGHRIGESAWELDFRMRRAGI
jgi:hypothetical protein